MRSCRPGVRQALTFVEFVVILVVFILLVALLLPAIHRMREAANQASCQNHLKTTALAVLESHEHAGVLPSNGGLPSWKQKNQAADGTEFTPFTNNLVAKRRDSWGVGEPDRSAAEQPGSWAYAILPYLGRTDQHRDRKWDQPLASYHCPSRRRPMARLARNDEYGEYQGGGWAWAGLDFAANALLAANRSPQRPASCLRLKDLTDGTSVTLLLGEKAMDPRLYDTGSWFFDEPFFLGGSESTARRADVIARDEIGLAPHRAFVNGARAWWGAPHLASAQFAFADGSVRSLAFEVAPWLLQAYLTPSGSEALGDD